LFSGQSHTVLVVDDAPQIRRVIRNALNEIFDKVIEARTGGEAIDLAASHQPALIVLDLGLPDIPGESVCREIRKWSTAPIIVVSARDSDREKISLLDAGADDYMTKPFSAAELRARVRAQLRRANLETSATPDKTILVGGLSIDLAKPAVTKDQDSIHLTKLEWDLLRALVKSAGRTVTHEQLFGEVWGHSYGNAQQHLRVHVRSLRQKLEPDPVRPVLIVTEPGVGYRFEVGE
jgi:two-component system, OmpR family, KDP operon response regulator KdpE